MLFSLIRGVEIWFWNDTTMQQQKVGGKKENEFFSEENYKRREMEVEGER